MHVSSSSGDITSAKSVSLYCVGDIIGVSVVEKEVCLLEIWQLWLNNMDSSLCFSSFKSLIVFISSSLADMSSSSSCEKLKNIESYQRIKIYITSNFFVFMVR